MTGAFIFYCVEPKRNTYAQLFKYLQARRDESGIIYCLSRKTVDGLAADLRTDGFSALTYHAGLDKDIRELHQEQFLKGEVKEARNNPIQSAFEINTVLNAKE